VVVGNGSLWLNSILSLPANSMLSWLEVLGLLHVSNATRSIDGRTLFVLYRVDRSVPFLYVFIASSFHKSKFFWPSTPAIHVDRAV